MIPSQNRSQIEYLMKTCAHFTVKIDENLALMTVLIRFI